LHQSIHPSFYRQKTVVSTGVSLNECILYTLLCPGSQKSVCRTGFSLLPTKVLGETVRETVEFHVTMGPETAAKKEMSRIKRETPSVLREWPYVRG